MALLHLQYCKPQCHKRKKREGEQERARERLRIRERVQITWGTMGRKQKGIREGVRESGDTNGRKCALVMVVCIA